MRRFLSGLAVNAAFMGFVVICGIAGGMEQGEIGAFAGFGYMILTAAASGVCVLISEALDPANDLKRDSDDEQNDRHGV